MHTRNGALDALEAVVGAALTAANKKLFRGGDVDATTAGVVIMSDGDPGEPEVILSPRCYAWEHTVPFEITAKGDNRRATVKAIIDLFPPALAADPTLGGAVDFASLETGWTADDYAMDGVETEYSAKLTVTLSYVTASGAG
jgi:hypothetical protein